MSLSKALLALCLILALAGTARADESVVEEHLTLANHSFDPQVLTVPAGKKIKLTITNKDPAAAEFESNDLNREKVVPANGEIHVNLGPLDAGSYDFYDDFHRTTTTGKLVAQ